MSASDILTLQRTAGNHAVQQILAQRISGDSRRSPFTIQAKLAVGSANDSYEREADRVAATVMQTSESSTKNIQRMPSQQEDEEVIQAKPLAASITPLIQRQEMTEEEDEKNSGNGSVQRSGVGGVTSIASAQELGINQARGMGQKLPDDLRGRMEQAFGADFSGVRVHADSKADTLNRSLQARAFTTGQDLFFKGGEYNPASKAGQKLIAHELTHVVQQGGGLTRSRGVSVQRAPSNVIQRTVADAVEEDRKSWKMMSPSLKVAMVAAAPVLQPLVQVWNTGKAATSEVYKFLGGKTPGFVRAVLSGLVAGIAGTISGVTYGLAKGFLRGLIFGVANPLYSIGKRVARFSVSEARGIYSEKPTHPKYSSRDDEQQVNYNYDTKTDLANYTLLVGGTGSAIGKVIADKANIVAQIGRATSAKDFFEKSWSVLSTSTPDVSEIGQTLSTVGAASSGVGALASLVEARKGYAEWSDRANTTRQQRIGLGRGVSGTLSAAQQSATSAYHIGNLMQTGVAATAQVATGGLGIATGAVDLLRGGYAYAKASQNVARLNRLRENEALHEDTRKAAAQASSTQEMRKTSSLATIAKGVLTGIGGGLLAFSTATPVGWLLLAGGALIGGAFALKRWLDKRERKKEIAIRELGVEEERKEWEAEVKKVKSEHWFWSSTGKAKREALGKDPLERELKAHNFRDVGHFYSNYINYMANHLYNKAREDRRSLMLHAGGEIARQTGYHRSVAPLGEEITNARSKKDLEKALNKKGIYPPPGNRYLEIAELVESMGLRFDFSAEPLQPTPEKIGKALDT